MAGLAIDGAAPVRTTPWPPWPVFEADEVEAASAVLRSGKVSYWTGQEGRAFERELADWLGVEHTVVVSNGTVAIELALRGLGVSAGDHVVVPSRTFVATGMAVAAVGARPVFADVDPDSGNASVATIEAAITPQTVAVLVVHVAGWPCTMPQIVQLCQRRGLRLIEDCAQAHGAQVDGKRVGSFADVATFSFCQDKIMTTGGEGGMVATGQRDVWSRMWSAKDHGKSWEAVYEREHAPGFRWLHESVGTNARMTEMQAAIGRRQLTKLDAWVQRRRHNAGRLLERLRSVPGLRVPQPSEGLRHAHYRAYAYVEPDRLAPGWDRDRIMLAIAAEGVPCRSGSCSEIYRELAFEPQWRPQQRLPGAKALGETSLELLVHPTVSDADIDDVAEAVSKVMAVAVPA